MSVFECPGQQGAGRQEGGRLPAEPGEVRGQRGAVELQGGGVSAEGGALRATQLRKRRRKSEEAEAGQGVCQRGQSLRGELVIFL